MILFRKLLVLCGVILVGGCSDDAGNPFAEFTLSRPPNDEAVILFVSGAWADEPGLPRELWSVNADGSEVQRLTTCTELDNPCDYIQVVPSSNRDRIVAVRGAVEGDPEAVALYFVDLGRSVETIIAPARRVQAADWAIDDSFVTYTNGTTENLFLVRPNGEEDRALLETPSRRERNPRVDRTLTGIAIELLEETPGKSFISIFITTDSPLLPVSEGGPGTEVLPGSPYIVGSDSTPTFSPDSQLVLFRRLTGLGTGVLGTWDYWVAPSQRLDEGDEPRFLFGGGDLYRGAPDWGNEGILFVETDESTGISSLVVTQPDGSGRRVIHSEDMGFRMGSPRWLRPVPAQ